MKKLLGVAVLVALACVIVLAKPSVAADKPGNDVKAVMEKAHKGGQNSLLNKATGAKAEEADKKALLALYEDLAKNEPAKGDKEAWKKKTDAIVAATKDLVAGKQGAGQKVKQAANCKACHDAHKG